MAQTMHLFAGLALATSKSTRACTMGDSSLSFAKILGLNIRFGAALNPCCASGRIRFPARRKLYDALFIQAFKKLSAFNAFKLAGGPFS